MQLHMERKESRGHDELEVRIGHTTAGVGQKVKRDVRVEGV